MENIKTGFTSFDNENPFIGDAMKEIPYEVARKVNNDITKILCENNLTIRQAATMLDLVKAGLVDRYLVTKTT